MRCCVGCVAKDFLVALPAGVVPSDHFSDNAPSVEQPHLNLPPYIISLIPGLEYISTCLWPLRNRYSMAPKSFLSSPTLLRNSVLESRESAENLIIIP